MEDQTIPMTHDEVELRDAIARDRLLDARTHLVRGMAVLDRDGARRAQSLTALAITTIDDAIDAIGVQS